MDAFLGVRGAFRISMLGSVESRRMVNGRIYLYMHLVIYIMNEVVVYAYYINEYLYIYIYMHILCACI